MSPKLLTGVGQLPSQNSGAGISTRSLKICQWNGIEWANRAWSQWREVFLDPLAGVHSG